MTWTSVAKRIWACIWCNLLICKLKNLGRKNVNRANSSAPTDDTIILALIYKSTSSTTRLGDIWKLLAANFLTKVAQIFGNFLCFLKSITFKIKTTMTIFGNVWGNWANFYSSIWSNYLQGTDYQSIMLWSFSWQTDLSISKWVIIGSRSLYLLPPSQGSI